jgi:hypothetical protein
MASQIETVIVKLKGIGFFEFVLPFLLTAAIFYGLLRKSKVFGDPHENVAVNAIVALVAGFMVWAYPVLAGVEIQNIISDFFFKSSLVILVVLIGVLIAGMFLPPDLPAKIGEVTKTGKGVGMVIVGGTIVCAIVFMSAGFDKILFPQGIGFFGPGGFSIGGFDSDTLLSAIVILAMASAVIGIAWGGGKKGG